MNTPRGGGAEIGRAGAATGFCSAVGSGEASGSILLLVSVCDAI